MTAAQSSDWQNNRAVRFNTSWRVAMFNGLSQQSHDVGYGVIKSMIRALKTTLNPPINQSANLNSNLNTNLNSNLNTNLNSNLNTNLSDITSRANKNWGISVACQRYQSK